MRKTDLPLWNHFIKSLPLTLLAMALTAIGVLAATGTIDSPAAPDSTSSYTLEDVYQRLVSGEAGVPTSFTEPSVAPGTGTMHDLNTIMGLAPALDDANGAAAADVLPGQTFWGLTNGEWGLQTGSMPLGSDFTGADGSISFTIPDGYYSGKMATAADADLLAGNILDTVNIFGVDGNIPTQGDVTGADGSLSFAIPDGYYSGKMATAADADLIASNIRRGVTLFGVTGTYQLGWYLHTDLGWPLYAVDMVSATDGWAVGRYGRIYHWDGSAWSAHTFTAEGADLIFIDMVSATDGWAVGNSGYLYHWDGSAWSLHTTVPQVSVFYAVDMVSATDGWAIGNSGYIYHWNGSTWSLHTTTAEGSDLIYISMLSSTNGWVVGYSGRIYHWNGSTWSLYTTTAEGSALLTIDMVSATDGWAMGAYGRIYHWNGSAWSLHTTLAGSTSYAVDMVSATDGWAVGAYGYIYHWDGSTWSLYTTKGSPLYGLSMLSASNGWAVGSDGSIYVFEN